MSTVPQKYQPTQRLIDDPEQLRQLYCRDGLTVREIARQHTDYSRSAVYDALSEYGIIDNCDCSERCSNNRSDGSGGGVTGPVGASERGFDPPCSENTPGQRRSKNDADPPATVDWESIT